MTYTAPHPTLQYDLTNRMTLLCRKTYCLNSMTYCSTPYPVLLDQQYDLLFHTLTYCLNSMTYCSTPYPVLLDQQYDLLFHTLTYCLTNSMNYCSPSLASWPLDWSLKLALALTDKCISPWENVTTPPKFGVKGRSRRLNGLYGSDTPLTVA